MAPIGILLLDVVPRIGELLLEAEADAFFLAIDVEHDDVDFLADLEDFGRMADAAPAHIGDMEQAVEAVEVDERAEIGDVLDRALADVARGHFGEQAWRGVSLRSCSISSRRERTMFCRSWLILTTLKS